MHSTCVCSAIFKDGWSIHFVHIKALYWLETSFTILIYKPERPHKSTLHFLWVAISITLPGSQMPWLATINMRCVCVWYIWAGLHSVVKSIFNPWNSSNKTKKTDYYVDSDTYTRHRAIPDIIYINGYLIHISLIRFLSCLLLLNMLFDISFRFFSCMALLLASMPWHDFPLPGPRTIQRLKWQHIGHERNTIGHETNLWDAVGLVASAIKAETWTFCIF